MNAIAILAVLFGVIATVVGLVIGTFTVYHGIFLITMFGFCAFILWDAEQ